jgi:tripartite-type tricarboxylate transporter receptor subunit TctC
MASYGTGTISHVAGELFKTEVDVNMVHVPYRGGAASKADIGICTRLSAPSSMPFRNLSSSSRKSL